MIKTICTKMRSSLPIQLLACFFALSLSFIGTTSAFASPKTHFSPNAITAFCLQEAATIEGTGPNEVTVNGFTENDCGHPTTVTQKIVVTNGCEGTLATSSGVAVDTFTIPTGYAQQVSYHHVDLGCITCVYSSNGVLITRRYPNFVVIVNVRANGSFRVGPNTILAADNGPGTASFPIANTGSYAPICPRVV